MSQNDGHIRRFPLKQSRGPTFTETKFHKYYEPIKNYEGIHRYDPNFEWSIKEETRIIRKVTG